MKIGIITSWNDTLTLFKFLQRYDHEYVIYYDFLNHAYGDKTFAYSLGQIEKWIWFLIKKGCEKIIVPPVYELAIRHCEWNEAIWLHILPLFKNYLHNYCFTQSLVGKLWMFGDYADMQSAQQLISDEAKNFTLTEGQKNIKKFHFPFDYWTKETWLRKYYLDVLSYSDPMANKVVKYDLMYFKDAGIDTAIPFNYWYFNYQKTIAKFFNFKRTRFHKIEKLEEIFVALDIPTSKKYAVNLFYTDHYDFLLRNKKLMRLLQKWKEVEVKCEAIE